MCKKERNSKDERSRALLVLTRLFQSSALREGVGRKRKMEGGREIVAVGGVGRACTHTE